MKKNPVYIILGLVVAALIAVFVLSNKWGNSHKTLNQRFSLRQKDKIPYGLNVAFTNLQPMFPGAAVVLNDREPGDWDSVSLSAGGQAAIIITSEFNADDYELKKLRAFAEAGNDVFISTYRMSNESQAFFSCNVASGHEMFMPFAYLDDTLSVSLERSHFPGPFTFSFPGKRYGNYFSSVDENTTRVEGLDQSKRANFIRLRAGAGNIYLHLSPIAFTNYFLLHKSNMDYYEQVMSLIPAKTSTILWDEYYLAKRESQPDAEKGWFSVLMGIENSEGDKPFRAAFLLAIGLLLLYALLGIRRKQRMVPIIKKEANSSLDFARTIGRLYHDKGDHTNLARKMAAYFLEHVRSRYKLVTSNPGEEFGKQLHYKTGVNEELIAGIIHSINSLEHNTVTAAQLASFHKQLETFYKTA